MPRAFVIYSRFNPSAYLISGISDGLNVHIFYADEIATTVTNVIAGSGIMHQFSTTIYKFKDLDQFVKLTENL